MNQLATDLKRCLERVPIDVQEAVSLSRHSQFGIGGKAQWFVKCDDIALLPEIVAGAAEAGVPVTLLGAGSNTLIDDAGVSGLVVKVTDKTVHMDSALGEVTAAAGVMMPRLAYDTAKAGLAGLSFGVGIPGTVGASIVGNAGAWGGTVAEVLLRCEVADEHGDVRSVRCDEMEYAYRWSRLKGDRYGWIVLSATFAVSHGDTQFLKTEVDSLTAERKALQPYGMRSLGSTFKNPDGAYAGQLIESVGLKGRRIGGAEISAKHANFILNVEHATAADVLGLVTLMHDTVLTTRGIDLLPEIVRMPYTSWDLSTGSMEYRL